MSDKHGEMLIRTKEMLEKLGFEVAAVEQTPLPDRLVPMLDDSAKAPMILYYRVTTSLGTIGIIPDTQGVLVDMGEIGLNAGNFEAYLHNIEAPDDCIIGFVNSQDLREFMQVLKLRLQVQKSRKPSD